jgi:hypothetical protein
MTRPLRWTGNQAALREHEEALRQHPVKLKPKQPKRKRRKLRRRGRARPNEFNEFEEQAWRHLRAIWNDR